MLLLIIPKIALLYGKVLSLNLVIVEQLICISLFLVFLLLGRYWGLFVLVSARWVCDFDCDRHLGV